jgi:hypothetical protein
MKSLPILLVSVLLLGLTVSSSQAVTIQRSREASAQKAWAPFLAAFRPAVKKRDRAALKEMMARDFFYTLGHHASDQREAAFDYWDGQRGRGWKAFERILAKGAVRTTDKGLSNTGELEGPMRVAPPAAATRRSFRKNSDRLVCRFRVSRGSLVLHHVYRML